MKKLKKYFLIDKKQFVFVLFVLFFHSLFESGNAVLIWYLFDLLGKATEVMPIISLGIGAIVYILLAALMNAADLYYTRRYVSRMSEAYRKDLYDNILSLSYSDYQKRTSDEYITLINNDVNTISSNYFQEFYNLIYEAMVFLFALVIAFVMNYIVASILLVLSSLVLLFPLLFMKKLSQQTNQVSNDTLEFSKYIGNTFQGIDI